MPYRSHCRTGPSRLTAQGIVGSSCRWFGFNSGIGLRQNSFNPAACWAQVVDRPAQGHRFMGREYVQPQWVFDSLNWRVLVDARLYAPGGAPPPHLSPFANPEDEAGDDAYVPEYAKALRKLQARALRAAWSPNQNGKGVCKGSSVCNEDCMQTLRAQEPVLESV